MIPPAIPQDTSSMSKMSRSLKRKQKAVVEPKPEIDLSTALPNSNDFRTSLLMPGLTARFSMLREQDDPTTKVGKASDDSVLFPKRASRMNLFAHNPLTDIAEVESITATIRPPFATSERSHSFSGRASYASDDTSSVLGKPRQTDGNNLFGGRQKMYRLPGAGSARDLADGNASLTTGKHIYQNDFASSSQHLRHEAEDEQELEDEFHERPTSIETDEREHSSVVNTPSTGFSKSRGTTSSTASGPSNRRTSTAATSMVSDSPVPRQSNTSAASNMRMNALDCDGEDGSAKRNFSSESRRALHGEPAPVPASPLAGRQLAQSRSATTLSDRYTRSASPIPSHTPRATSPPPTTQTRALASLDFGLNPSTTTAHRFRTTSPSKRHGEGDLYTQSLEPNDRGKATAMGLFNRPRLPFDEQKFQERQLKMHEDRIASPTGHGPENDEMAEQEYGASKPLLPIIPSSPFQTAFALGPESDSTPAAARTRTQSNASSTKPAQVQAQVEALIKRQNEEYTSLQPETSEPTTSSGPSEQAKPVVDQPAASAGTFYNAFDGSDEDEDEADLDSPMLGRFEPAPQMASLDVHPALRDGTQSFDFGDQTSTKASDGRPHSNASRDTSSPSSIHDTPDTSDSLHRSSQPQMPDSPTLGPTTGLGLSGLIRAHLRHDSDRSSLLPPPSPVRLQSQLSNFPGSFRERESSVASTTRTINPPESTHSDPWEFETAHRPQRSPLEPMSKSPLETMLKSPPEPMARTPVEAPPPEQMQSMFQRAQQILGQARSHKKQAAAASKAQQILGSDAPAANDAQPPTTPWQSGMMTSHHRGESTETQKEFGNELAERARRVQEGLKGAADMEKRSRSPALRQDRPNPAAQALHALRSKQSRPSLGPRANDSQPKAMKLLGLGGPRPDGVGKSPYLGGSENATEQGRDEFGNRLTPRQRAAEFEPPSGRRTPGFGRPGPPNGPHEDFERSRQRSATPVGGRASRGERAHSVAADRSRSRTGRYRDEQSNHAVERGRQGPPHWDQQRPHGRTTPDHRGPRGPPPVETRPYERSASAMSNRRPSGTRPGPSGVFEGRALTPTLGSTPQHGGEPMAMNAPRPSPRPPFPHSPLSPLTLPAMSPGLSGPPSGVPSTLPSPIGSPPPSATNGRSTPVDGRSTPAGTRKKSVTKGMISEPTFISSTSSVPLVGLPNRPRPSQIATPPIPMMNPRRRSNSTDKMEAYPGPRTAGSPMPPMPESPHRPGGAIAGAPRAYSDQQQQQKPAPRHRNRLRKISSEGGSMAAKARNQAMLDEFGQERLRSPALPVFPNRSATSLGLHQDGGMF